MNKYRRKYFSVFVVDQIGEILLANFLNDVLDLDIQILHSAPVCKLSFLKRNKMNLYVAVIQTRNKLKFVTMEY